MSNHIRGYFNYIYSYPQGFRSDEGSDLSGVVFYVGKGTHSSRMDDHLREAAKGCGCEKCCVIRWIWEHGQTPSRSIVFEDVSEQRVLDNERHLIQVTYRSVHLTNVRSAHEKPPSGKHGRICYANMQTPPVFNFDGEVYYNTAVACRCTGVGIVGTRFLFLAEEFGLSKMVRENTVYYRKIELLRFIDWVNENHPGESISPNTINPELDLPLSMFVGVPFDG